MLSVQNGASYTGGLFTIYIGEVRALREGQGGGMSSPGVLVCISTIAGGEDGGAQTEGVNGNGVEPVDFEFAQATIRELWGKIRSGRDLGRGEVKEVFMAPQADVKTEETGAMVRMWCEILRLRG
jgi:hypothetical protein